MSISYSGSRDDVLNGAYVSSRISVSTSQVEIKAGAQALTNRQEILIYNDSAVTVYFGPSGVTTSGASKGIPVEPQETVNLPFSDEISVYAISTGPAQIIVQEFS